MAIDSKYGRVTLEHGDIGEDEPVFVFRARDAVLPELLLQYHRICTDVGSPQRHLDAVLDTRTQILSWQDEHGTKIPDSENSRAWMG